MAHFAKINKDNIVEQVIVADQEFIDSGAVGDPSQWLQTSYNTRGGVHLTGGVPLRKNFAGIGDIYNPVLDAFYQPQPYPSWILDEETCTWVAPIPKPDGHFYWDEDKKEWVDNSYLFSK